MTEIIANSMSIKRYEYNSRTYPDKPSAVIVPLPSPAIGDSYTYYEYDEDGRTTKVTDPVGNITEYTYDSTGNLTKTKQTIPISPTEDRTIITGNDYNDFTGLLEKTIDANGNSTSYDYDSRNRLKTVTQQVYDPNQGVVVDVVTSYTYDDNSKFPGSPNSITDPAGFTRYFEYDENGNQIKSWYYWEDLDDSNNYCNVYTITEYDAAGRVVKTIRDVNDVNGTVEAYTVTLSETKYIKIGKPDITINSYDGLTKYWYDELGNLVETCTYDSNQAYTEDDVNNIVTISRTLYDAEGQAIITIGPYDPCGTYNPVGTQTFYDYLGREVKTRRLEDVNIPLENIVVDGNVVGKTNIYDDDGNPFWSHGKELWATYTYYDVAGRVDYTVSDSNVETNYEYDAAGKQTKVTVTNPAGNDTVTEYGYEGNQRVWMQDARGNITRFVYDDLGRVTDTYYPETAQNGQTSTHVAYDALGRRTAQTDQAGRTRWFDYDKSGRLKAVILSDVNDPYNGNTPTYPRYEYEYDTYGNLITIRDNVKEDPNSGDVDRTYARETRFTYNELHKQTSRTLPDGRTEYKEYDEHGRLTKATDFNDHVTTFEYNARGLLEYRRYYANESDASNPANADPNIYFEYDALGRKVTEEINGEFTTYSYDNEGKVREIGSPQGFIVYDYWPATGQRKSVYTPSKEAADTEIKYYYDDLTRLEQVQVVERNGESPTDEVTTYSYNEVGSLEGVEYANGNYAHYWYDALNRLTNLTNFEEYETNPDNPTADVLSSFAYTLADDGMRTAVTEVVDGSTTTINWTYDALNRLTKEVYDANGDSNDFTHTYIYDLVGNRLERQVQDGNTTYYYYDPNTDELTQEITDDVNTFYYYDDNGSLVEEANDTKTLRAYTYTLRNRLASASVTDGYAVDYTYNPDGIRVKAEVTGGSNPTIEYLIDPYNHTGYAQVLKEVVDNDANTVYVLGHDVLAQATGGNAPKYLLYDGHGSVRQVVQSSSIIGSFAYDAYGNARNFTPDNAATKLLYAGEMFDGTAAQYYLRARWYSPVTGRFNRMDPFAGNNQDPQSLHKYLYAHCNPINGMDPSGQMFGGFSFGGLLMSMTIGAVIGGLISGLFNVRNQIVSGADFDLMELLREIGCGALIGALAGAAGYTFSFIAKSFLTIFMSTGPALTVGTGALTGLAAAFVGQVLTELKYWIVDKKPFVLRDAAYRVILMSFIGLVTGGILTRIHLHRGLISDIHRAPMMKGLPGSVNTPHLGYVKSGWLPQAVPTSPLAHVQVSMDGLVGGICSQEIADHWISME